MKTVMYICISLLLYWQGHAQMVIDSSFNSTGVLDINGDKTNAVGVQSDGKIVYVSNTLVHRYLTNGTLDLTFGNSGTVALPASHYAIDVLIMPDDGILVGGVHFSATSESMFSLCRFEANGATDFSFGNVGVVIDTLSEWGVYPSFASIRALALQPDGKIVATGHESVSLDGQTNAYGDFATVRRYMPNGDVDTSFQVSLVLYGPQNYVIPLLAAEPISRPKSIILQPDGKILIAGGHSLIPGANHPYGIGLLRLHANGVIDSSFGTNGSRIILTTGNGPSNNKHKIALFPNGNIISVAFNVDSMGYHHTMLDSSGFLVSSFGTNGRFFSSPFRDVTDIYVRADGGYNVVGSAIVDVLNSYMDFNVQYFTANGGVNTNCNGGGGAFAGINAAGIGLYNLPFSSDMGPNGEIVVCGLSIFIGKAIIAKFERQFSTDTIIDSSCVRYHYNGTDYTSSGIYKVPMMTSTGCDSLVVLDLHVTPVDNVVMRNGTTLTAPATSTSYQWINCNTGQPIAGETMQTFTAKTNGSYAVIVTENGCTDTSACYAINNIGLNEWETVRMNVYPNPSSGSFSVAFDQRTKGTLEIYSLSGQQVFQQEVNGEHSLELQLELAKGVYLLRLSNDEQSFTERLIIH